MLPYHYALCSKAQVAKFKIRIPLDATGTIAHVQTGNASGECLEAVKSVDRSTGKCLCFCSLSSCYLMLYLGSACTESSFLNSFAGCARNCVGQENIKHHQTAMRESAFQ